MNNTSCVRIASVRVDGVSGSQRKLCSGGEATCELKRVTILKKLTKKFKKGTAIFILTFEVTLRFVGVYSHKKLDVPYKRFYKEFGFWLHEQHIFHVT